jgi:hypothetical protein
MTFEGTSLTDPVTGADGISGGLVRETGNPIRGLGSVRVPNLSSAYLNENFTAAPDAYVALEVRLTALPSGTSRVLFFSDQGTTIGNIQLLANGRLRLRNGTIYRVGLHQRGGTGSNALLEAFLAPAGTAFGAPFASLATGTWTTSADRLRFGATSGSAIDVTADTIAIDGGAMPGPATATPAAVVGNALLASTAGTGSAGTDGASAGRIVFNCMFPVAVDETVAVPQAAPAAPVGGAPAPPRSQGAAASSGHAV